MKRFCLLSVSCLIGLSFQAEAQTASEVKRSPERPLIGLGAGITMFRGDVGASKSVGLTSSSRVFFSAHIEQRLHNWFGLEFCGVYGKLANAERSLLLNRNFESSLMQFGLNGLIYFDNNIFIKRNSDFTPYLALGASYMLFDPYSDLRDASNTPYHYWSDGAIRDQPETTGDPFTSVLLQRDYTYETQLKDSTTTYARNAIAIPLAAGFRFRFGQHLGTDLRLGYTLTMTDYIDNVKAGGNDAYATAGVSLWYKFGVREKETGPTAAELLNADFDGDGVADANDACEGTPKGIKVDRKGCPEDSDNDGIADYLDKEPNSAKNAAVDGNGVTIDFAKIEQQQLEDSIRESKRLNFQLNPSMETLAENNPTATTAKTTSSLPIDFQPADKDKNGLITADEINFAIDDFFDGNGNWTVEKINRLIDYFFEQ